MQSTAFFLRRELDRADRSGEHNRDVLERLPEHLIASRRNSVSSSRNSKNSVAAARS